MFELMQRAVPDPQRRAPPPRLDRLRPATRPRSIIDDGGDGRSDHRARAQRRAPADRGVHAARQRDGRRAISRRSDAPALYRIHEEPDVAEGREVRGVHLPASATASARRSTRCGRGTSRSCSRGFTGKPEEKPIAMLMLRTMQKARYDAGEPRPLRPGGAELHALHVADPPLSGSGRPPRAARGAARPLTDGAREELDRGSAGDRAAHLRDGAPRRRRRARAAAVEEGPVHGRQGRRRVRRLHHRRRGVRPVHRAGRALRRRAWSTSRRWPTTTTGSSSARTCCAARTRRRCTGSATRCSVQVIRVEHGAAADRSRAGRDPRARAGRRARRARRSKAKPKSRGARSRQAQAAARQARAGGSQEAWMNHERHEDTEQKQ